MDVISYAIGKKAGGGQPQPISLQAKEVEIIENGEQTITPDTGYDGLSKVDITTNVAGSEVDWTEINFIEEPKILKFLVDDAKKTILDNWDVNNPHTFENDTSIVVAPALDVSNLTGSAGNGMFMSCTSLTIAPDNFNAYTYRDFFRGCSNLVYVDLSNYSTERFILGSVGSIREMFSGCSKLKHINFGNFEKFDVTKTNAIANTFNYCYNLDDETLNDILKLCILITDNVSSSNRKISTLGITNSTLITKMQALSNYNDFVAAGWSLS